MAKEITSCSNDPLLRLLAPTVLVSLVLVIACVLATILLNSLTESVSRVLNENVRSTAAAEVLEQAVASLIKLLREQHPLAEPTLQQIQERNRHAQELLSDANSLANYEQEKTLIAQVEVGLRRYKAEWESRKTLTVSQAGGRSIHGWQASWKGRSGNPVNELRRYNQTQIETSDREIRAIVTDMKWGLLAVGLALLSARSCSWLHDCSSV